MPSFTSAAACLRLAGVIKFAAPSSSSCPHRPQFDRSFIAWWNSASVVVFLVAGGVGPVEPDGRRGRSGAPITRLSTTLLARVIIPSTKHHELLPQPAL